MVIYLILLSAVRLIFADSQVNTSMDHETTNMEIIVTQDLSEHRRAELCARHLSLEIGSDAEKHSIPGRFLWLNIKDNSGNSKAVWREWFAVSKTSSIQLYDFIIYQRDKEEIALAFMEGYNIRFWLINLNTGVDVDQKAVDDYVKGVARIASFINTPSNIPLLQMLKVSKAENKQAKLLDVTWKDGRWQVHVQFDSKQITFVRGPTEDKWKLNSVE
jgi:hypothetical protein